MIGIGPPKSRVSGLVLAKGLRSRFGVAGFLIFWGNDRVFRGLWILCSRCVRG